MRTATDAHPSTDAVTSDGYLPVVFVAQIGTPGKSWQPVIDRMATTQVTAVTYDRPGTGDRAPRPAPNPPLPYSTFASELARTLDELDVTAPAVLVGHSVGSLITRVFADRYPDRVAGMVHIDASIPRLTLWPGEQQPVDGDGPQATAFDTIAGEVEVLAAVAPTVPTLVVTRTPGRWDIAVPHPAIDRLWSVHQHLLARQCGAPLVTAVDAAHQIPAEAPALVAYAVDVVTRAVRAGSRCDLEPELLHAAGGR